MNNQVRWIWLLGLVVLVLGFCGEAWGIEIYVDDDGAGDLGPGDTSVSDPLEDGSLDHPFDAIQEGIVAAVDGDVVIVLEGTYRGEGNRDIDFWGKGITVRSIDPNDPDLVAATIVDCQSSRSDPHRGFFFHSGEDKDSILSGLTIINGRKYGDINWGGATQADAKHVIGGGIYCGWSNPTITRCVIKNCRTEMGGGIGCYYAAPLISYCTIGNCDAGGLGWCLSGGIGGGIGLYKCSEVKIIHCVITDNECYYNSRGGGIDCSGSSVLISDCVISKNITHGSLDGGGISCSCGSVTIKNCIISENTSHRGARGAGVYCYECTLLVSHCAFIGNQANDSYGGGMYCYNSDPMIGNCIFSGNSSTMRNGGGVYCNHSNPTFINCTFNGNRAKDFGGGIYGGNSSNPILINSILWNNTPGEIYVFSSGTPDVSYCNIRGGWEGVGNIDTDPKFVDADGFDDFLGTEDDDLRLLVGSPCIDAGDNSAATTIFDLDGRPRIVDGDGDGAAVVDMGAYEFTTNHRPVADAGGDLVVWAEVDGLALVELDGSGSSDGDGDDLVYRWSWVVEGEAFVSFGGDGVVNMLDFAWWAKSADGTPAVQGDAGETPAIRLLVDLAKVWLKDVNVLETPMVLDVTPSGPYLVVELPVGVYEVTLVVNDGVEDSEPNSCVVTVLGAGDLDGDGEVDVDDLEILLLARNEPADGPGDPRDLDGDGVITVLDARMLVTLFTR